MFFAEVKIEFGMSLTELLAFLNNYYHQTQIMKCFKKKILLYYKMHIWNFTWMVIKAEKNIKHTVFVYIYIIVHTDT